jgi:hypothetical protein
MNQCAFFEGAGEEEQNHWAQPCRLCMKAVTKFKAHSPTCKVLLSALAEIIEAMAKLTHISLLQVEGTLEMLRELHGLLAIAPKLTHVRLSTKAGCPGPPCTAAALLASVVELPTLQKVDLRDFGQPLYGCMFTMLAECPKLQKVIVSRADLKGCVPSSVSEQVHVVELDA